MNTFFREKVLLFIMTGALLCSCHNFTGRGADVIEKESVPPQEQPETDQLSNGRHVIVEEDFIIEYSKTFAVKETRRNNDVSIFPSLRTVNPGDILLQKFSLRNQLSQYDYMNVYFCIRPDHWPELEKFLENKNDEYHSRVDTLQHYYFDSPIKSLLNKITIEIIDSTSESLFRVVGSKEEPGEMILGRIDSNEKRMYQIQLSVSEDLTEEEIEALRDCKPCILALGLNEQAEVTMDWFISNSPLLTEQNESMEINDIVYLYTPLSVGNCDIAGFDVKIFHNCIEVGYIQGDYLKANVEGRKEDFMAVGDVSKTDTVHGSYTLEIEAVFNPDNPDLEPIVIKKEISAPIKSAE